MPFEHSSQRGGEGRVVTPRYENPNAHIAWQGCKNTRVLFALPVVST